MSTERDERQQRVYDWVRTTFGLANQDARERVLRFFEEAVELAQAEGVPEAELLRIVQHVMAKPPGAPEQEAGGAGTTLLAYCAAKGFSADTAERREFERVLSVPAEHFRRRHQVKAAAGIAIPSDIGERVDRCPRCKLGLVLECNLGWWCSRRYDSEAPCDWEQGDPGPSASVKPASTEHDTHVRKYKRRRALRQRDMLKPRRCDACKQSICCFFGQRSVDDAQAPGGVWILHPTCSPPIHATT